jgi:hypothetical protein
MDFLRQVTRIPGVRALWCRYPIGKVPDRVRFGIWERPHYAYGVNFAADMAKKLGLDAVSVIEFGVAGGRGLLSMEDAAERIGTHHGVKISVWGFDAAVGLPKPVDYRDLPHVWGQGDYVMDVSALKARLRWAQLILGDVSETIPPFLERADVPPIGFISIDLDYYSSTAAALKILDGPPDSRLPRVCCYFDDILWPEDACHNEYVGERLAINEYNAQHECSKISKLTDLRWTQPHAAEWHEQIYIHHDFRHPLYTKKLRGSAQHHL